MVYVVANDGQPLMPTERHGKVCRMLRSGMAKVIKKCPFTIQLQYESERNVQPVSLGVDAGSKHIGISATTKAKVLYESDVELRDDIVKLLATRRQLRRSRRSRKTRYRPARFDNRKRKEGWLAPSIRQKIGSHLTVVANVCKILPINQIIVETASFDIQKIKNPEIQGIEYQQGEQMDFWNVREYVFFRDGHTCQCCKGRSKDKILNVHHIESRKTGGNAPNNLITLCETCHKGYHNGTVILPKNIKRGMQFKDAAFMGIMRWAFYNALKEQYEPAVPVSMTYGYLTKNTRIEHGLLKEHYGGAIIPLDDVSLKKHVGKFLVKDFVEDYCKKNIINKVMNNLNRASKKKISSIKNTVTAFLKSAEFSKANGAKATKALMQDDDFFSSIPDQSGTEFDAIYCTGAVADYYLHQKTEIQYEVLCKCIGKVWKEGLKKYAK